jgi:hypothetical protein
MSERLPPIGFWSYARQDDDASQGRLSSLRTVLTSELQQQYGREPVKIFQDVSAIPPGAEWEAKIRDALNDSTFFIPLITPNFIQSQWCTEEFFIFREREIQINTDNPQLKNERRIFPIYYVGIDGVEPYDPRLITELKRLQWLDFTHLRLKDYNQEAVREKLSELAASLRRLLHTRVASEPPPAQPPPVILKPAARVEAVAADDVADPTALKPKPKLEPGPLDWRRPRTKLLAAGAVAVVALACAGAVMITRHGQTQTVAFSKATRISAFPPTAIDSDTSDALWSDAADAGDKGYALSTTAGVGAGETAAVYLLGDPDKPPISWTGPPGSRGSAIAVEGADLWTGGEQADQAFVQALTAGPATLSEGWRRQLGAGRVMGLALARDHLLVCIQTTDATPSHVDILQRDGAPAARYAPTASDGRIELHRVMAMPDGGGVAVGWQTAPSASGAPGLDSLFAARFGADGREQWRQVIGQPSKLIRGNGVTSDAAGLEVVGWRRDAASGAFYQGVVETIDPGTGVVKGERIVRRAGSVLLRAAQPAGGGALFVAGVAFDNYLTDKGGGWLVAQIDGQGRVLDSDWNMTADRHRIAEALAWKPKTALLAFGFSAMGDRSSAEPTAALYPVKGAAR